MSNSPLSLNPDFDTNDLVGTTGQRPANGNFIGQRYFDTTLGHPIWCSATGPTVWRNADGSVADSSAPTFTSITPNFGTIAGSTAVTVVGTGFDSINPASGVLFGATPATSVVIVSDTELTCDTPAGAAGPVTLKLINAEGETDTPNAYTYETVPTVTSVTPNTGSHLGGTPVALVGTGFLGVNPATGVLFAASHATGVVINSDTSISCVSPAVAAGATHVTVVNPEGTSPTGAGNAYTFT